MVQAQFPIVEKVKAKATEIRDKVKSRIAELKTKRGAGGAQIFQGQGISSTVKSKLAEFHRKRAEALAGAPARSSVEGSSSPTEAQLKHEKKKISIEL